MKDVKGTNINEPTYFKMTKRRRIPRIRPYLILAGLCILIAGCSLKQKEPGQNTLAKAWMEAEKEKAALDMQKADKNHVLLARELMDKQYYDIALVQLKEAETKEGPGVKTYHLLGICYRETGELEKSELYFKKAISLDSDYAPAHNGLGLLYGMTDRQEKARAAFLKAIQKDPARPDFLNNLGFLEMQANRLKPAETYFKKSLRISPQYRSALNNLAVCYGIQGREKDAFSLLKKNYSPAEALNNMGVICRLKGEDKRAAMLFEQALKSDPGLESAKENLERIRAKK